MANSRKKAPTTTKDTASTTEKEQKYEAMFKQSELNLVAAQKEVKRLTVERKRQDITIKDLREQLVDLSEKESTIEVLRRTKLDLETRIGKIRGSKVDLEDKLKAAGARIEELENDLSGTKEGFRTLQSVFDAQKSQIEHLSAFLEDVYEMVFGDEGGKDVEALKQALSAMVEERKLPSSASPQIPEGKVLVDKMQLEEIVTQVQEMRAVCIDLTEVTIQTYQVIGGQIPKSISEAIFVMPKLMKKITSNDKYLNSLASMADKIKQVIPFVVPKEQALQVLRMFPPTPETKSLIEQVESSTKLLNK